MAAMAPLRDVRSSGEEVFDTATATWMAGQLDGTMRRWIAAGQNIALKLMDEPLELRGIVS
jgi:hypothetical protein